MSASAPRRNSCTSLIVIDSSKLRQRAVTDCRRARTTFEKAEQELQVFENEDKPAFQRWYRTEFGPLLEQVRETTERIGMLNASIRRIQWVASRKPCSLEHAARIYRQSREEFDQLEAKLLEMERREEERKRKAWEEKQRLILEEAVRQLSVFLRSKARIIQRSLKARTPPWAILDSLLFDFTVYGGVDPMACAKALDTEEGKALLAELGLDGALDFGEDDEEGEAFRDFDLEDLLGEVFGASSRAPKKPAAVRNEEREKVDDARIKALRRELAFALHPDQSNSASDRAKLELWYQVQEAVEARDLDRLEVLHAHMQVLAGELSPGTSVSRLMGLTAMYRSSRDALRRRIRSLRREQEWGFGSASPGHRASLRAEIGVELQFELRSLRENLRFLEEEYQIAFPTIAKEEERQKRPRPQAAGAGQTHFSWFA